GPASPGVTSPTAAPPPRPPRRSESVGVRPASHYGAGSQTKGFNNIAAAADSAIQQDLDSIAYSRYNFRQNTQSRRDTIELAAAVIGNHQGICSNIHCTAGVLGRVNTLDHDWPVPCLANPF